MTAFDLYFSWADRKWEDHGLCQAVWPGRSTAATGSLPIGNQRGRCILRAHVEGDHMIATRTNLRETWK